MKSLQVLARVLGSGLTIDPVQYSPVNYPFLAYHQYQNPQEKGQKLNMYHKVLKPVNWNTFQNGKRVLHTILAPFSGIIGVMVCLLLPKIWACKPLPTVL
jgi:hypothetical protein